MEKKVIHELNLSQDDIVQLLKDRGLVPKELIKPGPKFDARETVLFEVACVEVGPARDFNIRVSWHQAE